MRGSWAWRSAQRWKPNTLRHFLVTTHGSLKTESQLKGRTRCTCFFLGPCCKGLKCPSFKSVNGLNDPEHHLLAVLCCEPGWLTRQVILLCQHPSRDKRTGTEGTETLGLTASFVCLACVHWAELFPESS